MSSTKQPNDDNEDIWEEYEDAEEVEEDDNAVSNKNDKKPSFNNIVSTLSAWTPKTRENNATVLSI